MNNNKLTLVPLSQANQTAQPQDHSGTLNCVTEQILIIIFALVTSTFVKVLRS